MRWKNVMFCNSTFEFNSPNPIVLDCKTWIIQHLGGKAILAGRCYMKQGFRTKRYQMSWLLKKERRKKTTTTNKSHIKINRGSVGQKSPKWLQGEILLSNSTFFSLLDASTWCEQNLLSVYWCGISLSTFAEGGQRIHLCINASPPALHFASEL